MAANAKMLNTRSVSAKPENAQGCILIADDTPAFSCLLTDVLESEGYTVYQAQNGQMALDLVQKHLPELVLLDIAMPVLDGYGVCQKMKENPATASIPVIFCSGLDETEDKLLGFSLGAVDFITKPYQPREVLVRVQTHLELSRLRHRLEQHVAERTAELEATAKSLRGEVEARKQAEQELRLSAKAFDASPSAIMVTDKNGIIQAVNPAFTRLTGYTREEALGNTPHLIKSDKHDPAFYQSMWKTLTECDSWSGEIWNRRKDGNVVPMMESIHPVREPDGSLTHYIATLADVSESRDAQTLIDFLAYRDGLTGLPNRLVARKNFEQATHEADKSGQKIALLYMDLDRFKIINDSLGHLTGDQLLKQLSGRLTSCLGEGHMLARNGGDEFLIIAPNIHSLEDVHALGNSLLQEVKRTDLVELHTLAVTTSVGIALYPDDGETFEDLLKDAENALYACKKKGGDAFCLFTREMDAEARLRMNVENSLRNAVFNDEFRLLYQPKVSLATGKIIGAEALVRWNSPVLGFVSPANFIPLAEESGLILSIDEWVVETACRKLHEWQIAGMPEIKVSVNLSALQFRRGDLNALIRRVLRESGLDANRLELEITEGVLMENLHSTLSILQGLKDIGVSISLDDFGTGYSSLSYLQKLPIDTLKIDKSFVDDIHMKDSNAVIVRTIIALGHNLGLDVIAEGVEHQAQYEFLQAHGCDQIQGYYFSKPVPPEEFERMMRGQ